MNRPRFTNMSLGTSTVSLAAAAQRRNFRRGVAGRMRRLEVGSQRLAPIAVEPLLRAAVAQERVERERLALRLRGPRAHFAGAGADEAGRLGQPWTSRNRRQTLGRSRSRSRPTVPKSIHAFIKTVSTDHVAVAGAVQTAGRVARHMTAHALSLALCGSLWTRTSSSRPLRARAAPAERFCGAACWVDTSR